MREAMTVLRATTGGWRVEVSAAQWARWAERITRRQLATRLWKAGATQHGTVLLEVDNATLAEWRAEEAVAHGLRGRDQDAGGEEPPA